MSNVIIFRYKMGVCNGDGKLFQGTLFQSKNMFVVQNNVLLLVVHGWRQNTRALGILAAGFYFNPWRIIWDDQHLLCFCVF